MDLIHEECLLTLPKVELFEKWLKVGKNERNNHLYSYVSTKFELRDITKDTETRIKNHLASFSTKVATKWNAAGKSKECFLTRNRSWLDGEDLKFQECRIQPQPSTSTENMNPAGRPRKEFEDSSFKTKKRRVEDLVQSRSVCELLTAAEVASRSAGHRSTAKSIRDISESPQKSNTTSCSHDSSSLVSPRQCGDEALAYYIDSKSTTHTYKQTRKWSMKAGHHEYPSYHCLRNSKIACYPPEQHIHVTETRAELNLQALLDKTVERLIQAQREVINSLPLDSSFRLISKWGCDGSSGHSGYKQKFENSEDTDEYLFVFSLVPLRLLDDDDNIIWQNPRPSSTMYCRPIKFIFAKETTELTTVETNKVLEEISNLLPSICSLGDSQISVKHELLLTMTDGKVCNALTDTRSAQKCFICDATAKMMNEEAADFDANQDNYGFGLSTLHAWIRCFECFLHISYKLDIKKWQARSNDEKASVKQRSEVIRLKFKQEMGLIVDKPKPGFASTNDGNTARRFFRKPELSAQITGLDVTLIKKFDVLLRTLSSGFEINLVEFNKLCLDTRQLYLSLYSWYYMPATVHKILIHSTAVINTSLLPIGQLSEGAQEARNKDCRRFREHNTRKCSRIATNRDLLSMLLVTSDPLINSLRKVPKKKVDKLPLEVLKLLVAPSIQQPRHTVPRVLSQSEEDYYFSDSTESLMTIKKLGN